MIETLTRWEAWLGLALLLLVLLELGLLLRARHVGRTRNVSRLATHGLLAAVLLVYLGYLAWWARVVSRAGAFSGGATELPVRPWALALLAVAVGLLVGLELLALLRARRRGLTRNRSRLLSHGLMLLALAALVIIGLRKWDLYLERLADSYQQSLPPPEGATPL